MKKINFLRPVVVWVVIVLILAAAMKPHRVVSTEAFDGSLQIQGYSGYTIDVAYAQIESAELQKDLDYGVLIEGTDKKKEKSGIWENEMFGEYQLCVNAAISDCIILRTASDILVINYESAKSTESLYEAIIKQL